MQSLAYLKLSTKFSREIKIILAYCQIILCNKVPDFNDPKLVWQFYRRKLYSDIIYCIRDLANKVEKMEAPIYDLIFIMLYAHYPLTDCLVTKDFCASQLKLSSKAPKLLNLNTHIYLYVYIKCNKGTNLT